MSRRILAIVAAIVLAVLAGFLVVGYVSKADDRAIADLSPVDVLVVTEEIPQGTPADEVSNAVALEQVPASSAVPGSIESLDAVEGLIATDTLYPGEQVLRSRFASSIDLEATTGVEIPDGFHEVTVQLTSERVLGGHVSAGDSVALFASSDEQTRLILHKVLVTRVQGGATTVQEDDGTATNQAPADSLFVTLAVNPADAQMVVHAAEFYGIWLSQEPANASENLSTIERKDLFE